MFVSCTTRGLTFGVAKGRDACSWQEFKWNFRHVLLEISTSLAMAALYCSITSHPEQSVSSIPHLMVTPLNRPLVEMNRWFHDVAHYRTRSGGVNWQVHVVNISFFIRWTLKCVITYRNYCIYVRGANNGLKVRLWRNSILLTPTKQSHDNA
jgi:hypothetical protein